MWPCSVSSRLLCLNKCFDVGSKLHLPSSHVQPPPISLCKLHPVELVLMLLMLLFGHLHLGYMLKDVTKQPKVMPGEWEKSISSRWCFWKMCFNDEHACSQKSRLKIQFAQTKRKIKIQNNAPKKSTNRTLRYLVAMTTQHISCSPTFWGPSRFFQHVVCLGRCLNSAGNSRQGKRK